MFNQLIEAQRQFQLELLVKANVVGVAVGYSEKLGEAADELAIVVMVEQKLPIEALSADDLIPRELDGARTDVLEVGVFRAQNSGPRDRWRPTIPGGVTIGHPLVTAGTLGVLVKDRSTGQPLILSNNHVLANTNNAMIGDPILQPAVTDRGMNPGDIVARLERFTPLLFDGDTMPQPTPNPPPVTNPTPTPNPPVGGGAGCDIASVVAELGNALARLNGSNRRLVVTSEAAAEAVATAAAEAPPALADRIAAQAAIPYNLMDCALARPMNPGMFNPDILNIGRVSGSTMPRLGMRVRKHGRTTGYTEGIVDKVNATVKVGYTGGREAYFTNQVLTRASMSQGGDSGSLIVDMDSQNAVGLLFAGSSLATIFSPIDAVMDALNITFF